LTGSDRTNAGGPKWHRQIGDPIMAGDILDRIIHRAHRIEVRGESMRKNPPNEPER